jgi:dihydroorotate dehydrogenase (NAD+) catalytic subunit
VGMNEGSSVDLSVAIGGIEMKNPVMVASGTFGYGPEFADVVDLNRLGAMVVKGIRMTPWEGNRLPRMHEVPGGLLNAIGLQGPGVQGFVESYMPFLREHDVPVIVNIWGVTVAEYGQVAARLDGVDGVHGIELNISCPNIKEGGIAFGTNLEMARDVISHVRACTTKPLIPKLSPNVPNIADFARLAEDCGCEAVSLINTLPAMAIDIETRRPILANIVGGLSGPAVHPVAVKQVWEAARAVSIPVIGMGGITCAKDALEFLIAGASAVAVGTANFTDPTTPLSVIDGIAEYMERHGFRDLSALVGSVCV